MLTLQSIITLCLIVGAGVLVYLLIPSKNLISIPSVPIIPNLLALLTGMPNDQRIAKYISPLLFEHGIAKVWMGNWTVLIEDTDMIKEIFNKTNVYEKDALADRNPHGLANKLFGSNIVFTSGDEWKRHRKVVNPAFHRKWSTELINECIDQMIEAIEKSGGVTDVEPIFKNMALDGLGKVIFDFDFQASANPGGALNLLYTRCINSTRNVVFFLFPFLELFPIPSRRKSLEDIESFRAILQDVMEAKRKQLAQLKANNDREVTKDLLMMMVEAADTLDEDGNPSLTTKELIDDAAVLFVAGHDTTSNTLGYTLFHLATNPDIQDKARREVLQYIDKDNSSPTEDQVKDMAYLSAIIHESMRINSTVSFLPRILTEPIQLKTGHQLEKGQRLGCHLHASFHNPKRWAEPEKFNPDRFLTCDPTTNHSILDKSVLKSWFPFGGGSRLCVGMSFSLLEQKLVLVSILRKYKVSLPENSKHKDVHTGKFQVKTNPFGLSMPVDLVVNFEKI